MTTSQPFQTQLGHTTSVTQQNVELPPLQWNPARYATTESRSRSMNDADQRRGNNDFTLPVYEGDQLTGTSPRGSTHSADFPPSDNLKHQAAVFRGQQYYGMPDNLQHRRLSDPFVNRAPIAATEQEQMALGAELYKQLDAGLDLGGNRDMMNDHGLNRPWSPTEAPTFASAPEFMLREDDGLLYPGSRTAARRASLSLANASGMQPIQPEIEDETYIDPESIIAVVEFKGGRREVYLCMPNELYHPKQFVVVDGDRGEDLGVINAICVASCLERAALPKRFEQRVIRLASQEEIDGLKSKHAAEKECLAQIRLKVRQRRILINVVDVEYQYDRRRLTVYYECGSRVDFRSLVRDLYSLYQTRIWMQQVPSTSPTMLIPQVVMTPSIYSTMQTQNQLAYQMAMAQARTRPKQPSGMGMGGMSSLSSMGLGQRDIPLSQQMGQRDMAMAQREMVRTGSDPQLSVRGGVPTRMSDPEFSDMRLRGAILEENDYDDI